MNINNSDSLLENGEEMLGAEYEAWLDEVEWLHEIESLGIARWEGSGMIFVDDFRVPDEVDEEEDDLVY